MQYKKDVVIIVGAYATGSYYAPNFIARGYQCIHVHPNAQIADFFLASYRPQDFIKQIIWEDNADSIAKELMEFNVLYILPGSEAGVLVSDYLNHLFKLPRSNIFSLSSARRDKFDMQEALRCSNVSHIKSYKTQNFSAISEWIITNKISFPIVLKPLASAATDHVFICDTISAVKQAFFDIKSAKNLFLEQNIEVLIQEYIDGEEYVVNTISYEGNHYVSDIIKVHKKLINGSPVYDFAQLLCPVEYTNIYQQLTPYIERVLDALGIKFGPGHSELLVKYSDGQPVLIETAARPIGGIDPSAYSKVLGYNHISATVESYVNPNGFSKLLDHKALLKKLICVFLISPVSGSIKNPVWIDALQSLKCLHGLSIKDSGYLEKTTNLANCPGFVNLTADSYAALMADYDRIRMFEKDIFENIVRCI